MKSPRALAAAVTATVALLISGCGTADTAAVVDGRTISEAGVLRASEQIADYAQRAMPARDILNRLVVLPTVLEVLGERGVTVTDAAARSAVAGIGDPSPYLVDLAKLDLAIGQMTQEDMMEVTGRLADLDVEINPRYGRFNPQQASIEATVPDWLVSSDADL